MRRLYWTLGLIGVTLLVGAACRGESQPPQPEYTTTATVKDIMLGIVDGSADCEDAAAKVMRSKIFDHATSCSSENSLIILDSVYERMLAALSREGGALLNAGEKATLQAAMFPEGSYVNGP